jgi:hypothetical protein
VRGSNASPWDFLGFNQNYQGYPGAAIEHQSRAIRLSPLDPRRGFREACIGYAHLIDGLDEAALWARAAEVDSLRDEQSGCCAGDVAAWTCKAMDKALPDWVTCMDHDDGDAGRRLPRGYRCRGRY